MQWGNDSSSPYPYKSPELMFLRSDFPQVFFGANADADLLNYFGSVCLRGFLNIRGVEVLITLSCLCVCCFAFWFGGSSVLVSQNPGYMKENFYIIIESYHIGDCGNQDNVSIVSKHVAWICLFFP